MSDLTLYQLEPRRGGGFHFGQEGLELDKSGVTFPSDSLYAALTTVIAEQEGPAAATAFADQLRQAAPFRLSSLFPYAGQLPLLPLPRIRIHTAGDRVPRKFTKKVSFVSPQIFRHLCAGEAMDAYLPLSQGDQASQQEADKQSQACFLQHGAVWLAKAEQRYLPTDWQPLTPTALKRQAVWHTSVVSRVTIDRIANASSIYQSGRLSFNEECGLWLAVAYADESQKRRLELLLTHLGDRGIGGERTGGYGGYHFHNAPTFATAWPTAGDGRILLSRFLPQESETAVLQHPAASYQLTAVGGWAYFQGHRPLRRQRVTMLTEGSVLPAANLTGAVADVTPEWDVPLPHPIYRAGLALSLPIHLPESIIGA